MENAPDVKFTPEEMSSIERFAAQSGLPVKLVKNTFARIKNAFIQVDKIVKEYGIAFDEDVFTQAQIIANQKGISLDEAVREVASTTADTSAGTHSIKCSSRIGGVTMLDEYSAVDPEYWKREYRQACESGLSYIEAGKAVPDDVIHRAKTAAMNLRVYSERRGL